MPTVRKLRVANPHKKRKSRRAGHGRRNPGVLYLMSNPKKKHRSSRRPRRTRMNRHRRNPFFGKAKRSFRRRGHRRNPSIGGFSANDLLKLALGAAGGTLGTKYATQLILQGNNTGAMGYGVMAGVAIALGWLSAKFLGREVATGVVAGGLSAVTLRIFQEQVSGSSPASMSGYLGDPDFAGSLGEYQSGTYPVPGWSYGQAALPAPGPSAAASSAVIAAAAGAGAGVSRSPRSMPRS